MGGGWRAGLGGNVVGKGLVAGTSVLLRLPRLHLQSLAYQAQQHLHLLLQHWHDH